MPADTLRLTPARLASNRPRRTTVRAAIPAVVTSLIALGACKASPQQQADGDDPLAALQVTAESTRYNEGFWRAQLTSSDAARRRLFEQAVTYCRRKDVEVDGAKPNCRPVVTVAMLRMDSNPTVGGRSF